MWIKTLSSIIAILLCTGICTLAALDIQFTTAITQSPSPANLGNTVTFTVTFKTIGGAVDGLKITGGIDGSKIFERSYAHINADLQRTDYFIWVATAGSHTAWFELDPGHTTGDSNYGNNRIEKTFTVSGTPTVFIRLPEKYIGSFKPDLIIDSIQIIPASPVINDPVTLKVFVRNIGKAEAPKTTLMTKIYKYGLSGSDEIIKYPEIPAIPPGGTYEFTDSGQWFKESPGKYGVYAEVDQTKISAEYNELNNSKEFIFLVVR